MSSAKELALEVFKSNLHLLTADDQRTFRKTVISTIMERAGVSLASASTQYNTAKKIAEAEGLVQDLGRKAKTSSLAPKAGATITVHSIAKRETEEAEEEDCFTLQQIDNRGQVERTMSFHDIRDARKEMPIKTTRYPYSTWVIIHGLGRNSGDRYYLQPGERELSRYEKQPKPDQAVRPAPFVWGDDED